MIKLVMRFRKVIRNLYSLDCCGKSLHRLTHGQVLKPKIAHYHQVCFCSGYDQFLDMEKGIRFARGLAEWAYPQTPDGDFPNPFPATAATVIGQERSLALPDNVVSLDEVR